MYYTCRKWLLLLLLNYYYCMQLWERRPWGLFHALESFSFLLLIHVLWCWMNINCICNCRRCIVLAYTIYRCVKCVRFHFSEVSFIFRASHIANFLAYIFVCFVSSQFTADWNLRAFLHQHTRTHSTWFSLFSCTRTHTHPPMCNCWNTYSIKLNCMPFKCEMTLSTCS